MRIYTLTLSPAFDIHCTADAVRVGCENLAVKTDRCAGGKGINISRALSSLGYSSTAIIALGEESADEFLSMIEDEHINIRKIIHSGEIRENITIHTSNGGETRISFRSESVGTDIISRLEVELTDLALGDVLTVTGRVPDGVDFSELMKILTELRERGVRLVIDSRSFTLEDILALRPFLIKPNEEELSTYLDAEDGDIEQICTAAASLTARGVENVLVTLGARGAILASADSLLRATVPTLTPISTIGAGDSTIGGFLVATLRECDLEDCLRYATAFGTAACLTRGTDAPSRENIEKIKEQISIKVMR